MMRRFARYMLLLLVAACLAGCLGIAHTRVDVEPIKIRLSLRDEWNTDSRTVLILNTPFYGSSRAFVSIVTDSVAAELPADQWHLVSASKSQSMYVEFPQEQRHIGFPILFFPLAPSSETTHSRTFFVRLERDDDIYRIRVVGDRQFVEKASIAEARAALPPVLSGVIPFADSQAWSERLKAESDYYRDIRWTSSARLTVSNMTKSDGYDLLSISIGALHDG